jgi:hypothetical protein
MIETVKKPKPSAELANTYASPAEAEAAITRMREKLDAEARMIAGADLIGGVRPRSRLEAEALALRGQRDYLIELVTELRGIVRTHPLLTRTLSTLLEQTGEEAFLSDVDLDAHGATEIVAERDAERAGWTVRLIRNGGDQT